MSLKHALPQFDSSASTLVNPIDIIERMIDLRYQITELEQQLQALRPAFFAACLTFKQDTITLERATIQRRLTPGKWQYDSDITDQERFIKALKQQFQQDHDPISGREVIWMVKLLLSQM